MALVLADRVRETTTTTGTGTVTLAGAVTGFQSFSAIGNANTTYYTIAGQGTSEWEVGIGTYTSAGTTLSRDTVLASSNSGSLVSFSSGSKDVFCDYPAGKAVSLDTTGTATNLSIGGNAATATAATNVSGGVARQIPYQTAASTTTFITAPVTTNTFLYWTGSAFAWTTTVGAVSGSSPVSVSTVSRTATVSLSAAYGDTLNPYGQKTANYVLAAPDGVSDVPSFRALVVADVSNAGTMISQNANAVAITGGTINGTTIGATTSTTGKFTTVNTPVLMTSLAAAVAIKTSSTVVQFNVAHTASAVNYLQATGAVTTASPVLSAQGSDANVDINITPKGTGQILLNGTAANATNGLHVNAQTISANYTVAATDNAFSAGPVSVATGVTVTLSTGATWTIV